MISFAGVTVLVDGRILEGSTPATVQSDVVVAPVWPYAAGFARLVQCDPSDRTLTFERGGRTFRIAIGSPLGRGDGTVQSLPIAPYLRAGEAIIPLAAVARALGAAVAYDGSSRTLAIDFEPAPLATMTPYAAWSPPPGPLPTFTPTPAPEPLATGFGPPVPRRTPILVRPEPQKKI